MVTCNIYLAGPYTSDTMEYLNSLATKFQNTIISSVRINVVSTWHYQEVVPQPDKQTLYKAALAGIEELAKADIIAVYQPEKSTSGAIFVEMGIAHARGIPTVYSIGKKWSADEILQSIIDRFWLANSRLISPNIALLLLEDD